jgi:hypothetical protein
MKRFLCCVIGSFVLMIAISALAQDATTSGSPFSPQSITPVTIQGKLVSIYSGDPGSTTIPAYSAYVSLASTTVPSKYKSKSQWLIVHVTLQEYCYNDPMGSMVYVDGLPMYPSSSGAYRWECNVASPTYYETRTRTFVFPPENLGGPAITPGATVDVRATSLNGTAVVTERNVIVQAVK